MYLSLVLCCLVELGKGARCYQTKDWNDAEVGGFDKSKLEEKTCDSNVLYCDSVSWYDEKAKASESLRILQELIINQLNE